jgi:hypothetical protein
MTILKAPELLLPAGSLDKMRAAYDFGADAVYAGQPRYSLRARNNEFKLEQIRQGISEAHARGKKFFVTSNLIAHNDKIRTYLRDIEPVIDCKPDALIMADAGLIMMVKEKWPEQVIHLSVQANTTNWAAVKFWQKMGVGRFSTGRTLHRRGRALRCVGRCNTGREVGTGSLQPDPNLKAAMRRCASASACGSQMECRQINICVGNTLLPLSPSKTRLPCFALSWE